MALSYVGLSGFKYGIASDEGAHNIRRFEVEVKPEIYEWLAGKDGQARGFCIGDPMRDVTMEIEISGSLTVMAYAFGTAAVPVNSITYFGASAGGLYLESATVTSERSGWMSCSLKLTSRFNVT